MDSIGLSSSTVGRTFIEQSAEVLKEFETRRLDQQKYCALLLDGKCLQGRQIIIAMGVTVTGKKGLTGDHGERRRKRGGGQEPLGRHHSAWLRV